MKEKLKMIKLTNKEIRDKAIQLANMEMEVEVAKVKMKYYSERISNGIVEKEKEIRVENIKEQLKLAKAKDPKKDAQDGLKELGDMIELYGRNIKAIKIQLKDGKQPDFTKPLK